MTKFCEGSWRFLFYSCSFLCGVGVLYNKPWLWNTGACWEQYPYHTVGWDIWLYYMLGIIIFAIKNIILILTPLEIGFYVSLSITAVVDVKRKDFVQNMVHHLVTILLLGFSWSCHFIRVGTLVLIIHDCADPFLEFAKLCNYIKKQQVAEVVFGIFTCIWVFTRLII